ncbi:hypothetical protein IWQ60_005167 [Tieghemiomyces parasiticus]|uniref:ER membrane protein complex subunit 4 n=1 Tax=Tieghemiomyces parasiticus TaxID=78921 RepID=A0A9W8ACW2_9FUNG|nr:hypothetical protein IWQ60_005167 [Tieghemiomyces parasiticus]
MAITWDLQLPTDARLRVTKASKGFDPAGFSGAAATTVQGTDMTRPSATDREKRKSDQVLRLKKAWDQSLAPAKSLPMNLFMMWMSGNSVQIFNLVITVMMFFQPVKALLGVQDAFRRFEAPAEGGPTRDVNLLLPKAVFCLINLGCVALGLWKCSKMGLLPTTSSDWLAFETAPQVLDHALL